MKKLIHGFVLLLFAHVALSADDTAVDRIALATLMIYDAKYDKARHELEQADRDAAGFDAAKYYTVFGVLESKTGDQHAAIVHYEKAIAATKVKVFEAPKLYKKREHLFKIGGSDEAVEAAPAFDPEKVRREKIEKLYVYLSQAYYKIREYRRSVEALDNAGELGRNRSALFAFRGECYWKLKSHAEAIEALSAGYAKFGDPALLKQKFYYYAELELYQAAVETSMDYMAKVGQKDEDYVTLAQMLMGAGQIDPAITVLEEAKLRFPKNAKIGVLLAHGYLKKEMPYSGAALLESSAHYDEKYRKDAVEMFRRVRNYPHAIFLNSLMTDKVEKLRQKVAIHIDRGEFEKVIGLKEGMERYGMLEDDNLRYALAYAYYMARDYDAAEAQLKKIMDSELFAKATVIRKNIELCRDDSMECI